jgi:hypothetical protein
MPAAADAQDLRHDAVGPLHRLQRLGHDDVVERAVAEVLEPVVDVGLDHVDARREALRDVVRIDLEAVAAHVARPGQVRQQRAVTTAQIENPAARLDPFGDESQVRAERMPIVEWRLAMVHVGRLACSFSTFATRPR